MTGTTDGVPGDPATEPVLERGPSNSRAELLNHYAETPPERPCGAGGGQDTKATGNSKWQNLRNNIRINFLTLKLP